MSDQVQLAIITALATAIPIMFQHWLTQRAIRTEIVAVRDDVKTIEKATNSMKDALVTVTEREALGRGKAAGLIEGAMQEKAYPTTHGPVASVPAMMVMPSIAAVPTSPAAAPAAAPTPVSGSPAAKLDSAITDLHEAAKEAVVATEKTEGLADKFPKT